MSCTWWNGSSPQGVIVQFGGQTPLTLALPLQRAGVPIIGTSPESIDLAEDRKRFGRLLSGMGIPQPPSGTATSFGEAAAIAERIGYPVLVRPSYVLGGRAMVIVHDDQFLERYISEAVGVSQDRPILIDKFLEDAFEVDVDAVADGHQVVIGGIMEHIEEAGIHSGDSSCVLPDLHGQARAPGNDAQLHPPTGPGAESGRFDECAVRHQGGYGLRAGSQSQGLPHRSLREQGHRGPPGQAGGPADDRSQAGGVRLGR